jgi:catechol 2,3-dioxygenase-like lactoylglutathione lyase family enzyme
MPPILQTQETTLYASDLPAMDRFYTRVLGLRKVSDSAPRGMAFRVSPQSVLLIFNPSLTRQPHPDVPSHGATGPGHCAFSIAHADLDAWRSHLTAHAVAIEREKTWPTGAKSLYVRDPAGNSIELLAGNLWPD